MTVNERTRENILYLLKQFLLFNILYLSKTMMAHVLIPMFQLSSHFSYWQLKINVKY